MIVDMHKLNSNNQSSFADWYRTANSEFYLTGVQYEIGEQASEFQHRPFGEELLLCQRYYEICNVGNFAYHYNDQVSSNDQTYGTVNYKVNKPFNPTLTTLTGTVTSYQNPYTYGVSPRYGKFQQWFICNIFSRIGVINEQIHLTFHQLNIIKARKSIVMEI